MRTAPQESKAHRTAGGARGWPALALVLALAAAPAAAGGITVTFVGSVPIHHPHARFTEPSGLALSADRSHLWSVSDDTRRVFRLDFDGGVPKEAAIDLPDRGYEGVALTPDGARLLLVREEDNTILPVDLATGTASAPRPLAAMEGYEAVRAAFESGSPNKGLEGIAVEAASGEVYVLKEAEPRLLLRLAPGLDRILGVRALDAAAGFDESLAGGDELDVSGLAHDPVRGLFWIVSDRGRALYLFDWESGKASGSPLLATVEGREDRVRHAEGVALDPVAGRLFVVSDDGRRSRLFVYAVAQAAE